VKAWCSLVVLAACAEPTPAVPAPIETCTADAECSAGVCARTGECLAMTEMRKAQVIWTMAGQPPTEQSCYWFPTVTVQFLTQPEVNQGETWESGPLACTLGRFTIDRLPLRFWIGGVKSPSAGMWVPLDDNNVARVNLP
jgi:hypothetical protein